MDLRGAHDPMDRAASRPTRAARPRFRCATRRRHTSPPGVVPAPTASRRGEPMDRSLARRILLAALAIGVLADVVLDGPAFGLNVPDPRGGHARRGLAPPPPWARPGSPRRVAPGRRRWSSPAFVAVRADPFVTFLDIAGAAVFTGASMAAFSGLAVTRRSASVVHGHGRVGARGRGRGSRPRAARPGARPPTRRPAARCRPGSGPSDEGSSWRSRSC